MKRVSCSFPLLFQITYFLCDLSKYRTSTKSKSSYNTIILFVFIFCFPSILTAQWFTIPVPTTATLETIAFTDTLHGYIPLTNGNILESSDGGSTWQNVPTGSTVRLGDICFPTHSVGYSAGDNGIIVKTIDSGNTWPLINSPTTNILRGVFFFNPDTGFICGQGEIIYRTTDGGTTWILQTSGSYWLRQFSFPTSQVGYCAGDGLTIFKTTNGGLTWNQLSGNGDNNIDDIQFLTVDTGYVCGLSGYVAKSVNGGQSWQVLNTGTTETFMGLWFFNSQSGYCVGTSGMILRTSNGGTTWNQETCNTTATLFNPYFFDQNKGFICGANGTLLKKGNCLPSPGSITGPSPVCPGDSGLIYSINHVNGATGYNWSVPPGVIITSGNNTDSITVKFTSTASSGYFSVYAFNANCNSLTSPPYFVIVNPNPVPTITGPTPVCLSSTNNTYTTQVGMTNYTWAVSSGGIITSGGTATDNSVAITWTVSGAHSVSVNYDTPEGCKASHPAIFPVMVNALPGPAGNITGPQQHCTGAVTETYSVDTIPFAMIYSWQLPPGFQILDGQGTNTITVSIDTSARSGDIYVFGMNSCGDGPLSPPFHFIIKPSPVAEAGPDQTIPYDSTTTLEGSITGGSGSYSFSWRPSGLLVDDTVLDPKTVNLTRDTMFILLVTDRIDGCHSVDSVRIKILPHKVNEECLTFHNVITPNGDGLNDKWIIDCIENYPDNKVIIFNRWGDIVNRFDHYDNLSQVWKGTNLDGKPLPDGTYYYIVSIKNGGNYTGWILLRGIL